MAGNIEESLKDLENKIDKGDRALLDMVKELQNDVNILKAAAKRTGKGKE